MNTSTKTENSVKVIEDPAELPQSDVMLYDYDFVRDPYPRMQEIQRSGPVVYHPNSNSYLVTGWRDCARVLGNTKMFTAEDSVIADQVFGGRTMEFIDDKARHDSIRSVWSEDFTRPSLERQREMVSAVIDSRLDPFVQRVKDGETADAISGMARGIPTLVIAEMLSIPTDDFMKFSEWSDAMGSIVEAGDASTPALQAVLAKALAGTAALNKYMGDVMDDRAKDATPGPDLVSAMVHSPVAAEMTRSEIVASNTQLVFAGNETTAKLMGHTLYALAKYPDQRRELVANRDLIPQALEEIHRWSSIVQTLQRTALEGAEVGGLRLPAGAQITPMMGIANWDPTRWVDGDRLDIHRPTLQHLGFGFGMHSCLGLNLARMETQIWLNKLLDVLPEWDVIDIDWGTNWGLRGPARLEIAEAK